MYKCLLAGFAIGVCVGLLIGTTLEYKRLKTEVEYRGYVMNKLFRRWEDKQNENLKRRGFDFAAGRLLEDGFKAVPLLEQHIETAQEFGSYSQFDKGVLDAIRKFESK